jgi:hypothetical protein
MPRTGPEAFSLGYTKMRAGYTFAPGTCLKQQRLLWGIDAHDFTPTNGRDPWAIEAFDFAKFKHPTATTDSIPDFVPCYWRKNGRPGHIALYLKHGSGLCLTTDRPNSGKFGIVPVEEISRAWGMTFVGWTEDLNGVRVYTPPPPPPPPAKEPAKATVVGGHSRFNDIDDLAIELIRQLAPHTARARAAWEIHNAARPYRSLT